MGTRGQSSCLDTEVLCDFRHFGHHTWLLADIAPMDAMSYLPAAHDVSETIKHLGMFHQDNYFMKIFYNLIKTQHHLKKFIFHNVVLTGINYNLNLSSINPRNFS